MTRLRTLLPVLLALFAAFVTPEISRAQQPQGPIVRSIEVQYAGPASVSREKILANMRTTVGRPYSEAAVEEDIRTLYATGNVDNVRIFGEPQADGVKVIVVVAAKPTVNELVIAGVTQLKPSRIRKQITTKQGDALNEAVLETDRQKVLEYYTSRGYSAVGVTYSVERDERAGTARVIFSVNEGGKTTIRRVRFEGNTVMSRSELSRVVKTKPRSILNFFTKAGRLDNEQLDQDVLAIREAYQGKGHIDVQVAPPRIEQVDGKVDIVFAITEGPQYRVGEISFPSANVFTSDQLAAATKLRTGEIYSPAAVRADIKAIQDLYGTRGYVDFQAGATTTQATPQVISISYTIEEGVQSYVEHINISGNTRTKDKVIRREIAVAPGDVMNTVRVDASRARLQNLNYFSRVDLYPQDTMVPGRKDLNVVVEEKRTGSFNFGAGFSSIDSLLGFAEITQGNFDITRWPYLTGGGQKFRLRVQYGTRRKDFILALTEPYFMDLKLSVGGEIFFRDASFVSSRYDERRYGFDLNARKALSDFTFVRFGYRLENIGIRNVDEDASQVIRDEEGDRLKSQLAAGITYDTRDSVFLTRKGHRVDLSTYVAGGFLGGDTDIYGWDLEGSKYFPLPYDGILILNGQVATVENWSGGDRVPIFDRLFLGGPNNMRGFSFRDVGPKDEDGEPIGGGTLVRATVEYTFPIVDKIRGALFYDLGWVNEDGYKFSPKKTANGSGGFNQDVGIGVRLDLPIGPVRIDYGIPITTDDYNDSTGRFNFNIGYQF